MQQCQKMFAFYSAVAPQDLERSRVFVYETLKVHFFLFFFLNSNAIHAHGSPSASVCEDSVPHSTGYRNCGKGTPWHEAGQHMLHGTQSFSLFP